MLVYHGSIYKIEFPDVKFSKKYLDFGQGFYLTTFQKQAEKWALRKADRIETGIATVNIYELKNNWEEFKVMKFDSDNESWLDFVCQCRKGKDIYKQYDLIIGPVADDDVFKTINMYFRKLWDKTKTLEELRYYKLSNQICITNQNAVEKLLNFKSSYIVK